MAWTGIIFVAFLSFYVVLGRRSRPTRPLSDCSSVSLSFTDLFGDYSSAEPLPSARMEESDLSICTSSDTCCSQEMEERFHQESKDDLHFQLQRFTSFLGYSLSLNTLQFKGEYALMLNKAWLRMEDIFEEDYNRISGDVSDLLSTFFNRMRDFKFNQAGASDISDFVDNFFDKLFPLIYIEELNKAIKSGISKTYAQCLASNRKSINPFGSVPKWTTSALQKSLIPAKILLQSMELGSRVINVTNYLKLTKKCHNSLTRMSYCQYCSGYVNLKPCNALCLNVMMGCFAGLYDVDYHWSRFTSILVQLTNSMSFDRDLERTLRRLPKTIINGLSHLRNNKEAILEKATELCGNPEDVPQAFAVKTLQSLSGDRTTQFDHNGQSMDTRINVFSNSLRGSESFLRSLPNQICFLNKEASEFDSRCWTGRHFGNYNKFVVSGGILQQGRNPEVSLTGHEPELQQTYQLIRDLQNMHAVIVASISPPDDDSTEISGSGEGSGCYGDDECNEGSGSGSGDLTQYTTSVVPIYDTGDYVKADTTKMNVNDPSTQVPYTESKTDSDFIFDNTQDSKLTPKHTTPAVKQTTPTKKQTTIASVTASKSTTRHDDVNKFRPTKKTNTGDVETLRASANQSRLTTWALLLSAISCLLVL